MPWKLIFYLLILAIVLTFIGLNLGNRADISLGFVEFEQVPVFMGMFVAFFLGVIVAIPVSMSTTSRKTRVRSEKRFEKQQARREKAEQKKQGKRKKHPQTVDATVPSSSSTGVPDRPKEK